MIKRLPVVDLAPGDRVFAAWQRGLQIWRQAIPLIIEGLEPDGTPYYYDSVPMPHGRRQPVIRRLDKLHYPPGVELEIERQPKELRP